MPQVKQKLGPWIASGFVLAWLVAVAFGNRILLKYDYTAAASSTSPAKWPQSSRVPRTAGLPTIVFIAHPRCPCTRASMEELARLMARLHNQVTANVVFVRPHGMSEGWEKTDLWASAERIPGVTVLSDPEGVEAARFGAVASGLTLLYNSTGDLQFHGGITASRGHAGDNLGLSTIISLVSTGTADTDHTSVFGCSLHDPEPAVIQ